MQLRESHLQLAFDLATESLDYNLIDKHFDVAFADQLAQHEVFNKHLYRPNTYLHKWWARRCGSTFRTILKHLVRDAGKRDYYTQGGLEGQVILDPMMGGGTTLHEAVRLGANVIGQDIDPIPVLQARAAFSEIPLRRLEREFDQFLKNLRTKLGYLYRSTCPFCDLTSEMRFLLYGVRRRCSCQEAVFIDSYVLRHNPDGSQVHICPDSYDILIDRSIISKAILQDRVRLRLKNDDSCICGEKFIEDYSLPFYQRYVPLAVVGECTEHGLFFSAPQQSDLDSIHYANERRPSLSFEHASFLISPGPKSADLIRRGIHNYLDLFSSRQLLYMATAIEELKNLEPVIRLKLAMLLSTSTEFNSMLCGYKGALASRPGAIRHVFAHHAYTFPYMALENNPLHASRASGALNNLFYSRLMRGQEWAFKPVERFVKEGRVAKVHVAGEADFGTECANFEQLKQGTRRYLLFQGSSARLNLPSDSVDHIVTDPPYFDSVQYSDLAAFFRVWLRQMVPAELKWDYSLNDAAVDQQTHGDGQYESILSAIFSECHRVLKRERGRLIFTFHHWNSKAWANLTIALRRAGFVLVNRYVIHAENPASVHIANQEAIVHDVVLVLGSSQTTNSPPWILPQEVISRDSYRYCEQCGDMLGHLLGGDYAEEQINAIWSSRLNS